MNIVYTYYSDGIVNLDCGFCDVGLFLTCAKKSLRSAVIQECVDKVKIYTDEFGMFFLQERIDWKYVFGDERAKTKQIDWHLVDYKKLSDDTNYDKSFWNFPKLFTYTLQEEPFIHIDFDVILAEGFLKDIFESGCDVYTEKIRHLDCRPQFLSEFDTDGTELKDIICSGLIGGGNKSFPIFLENWKKALEYCKFDAKRGEKLVYEMLWGIEEYSFTKLVRKSELSVFEVKKGSYVHFQGKNKLERYGQLIKDIVV